MLYIRGAAILGHAREEAEWHVGETEPQWPSSRVVTFQADGDELELLVNAIKEKSHKHKGGPNYCVECGAKLPHCRAQR